MNPLWMGSAYRATAFQSWPKTLILHTFVNKENGNMNVQEIMTEITTLAGGELANNHLNVDLSKPQISG